jgi:hypothetical protein
VRVSLDAAASPRIVVEINRSAMLWTIAGPMRIAD